VDIHAGQPPRDRTSSRLVGGLRVPAGLPCSRRPHAAPERTPRSMAALEVFRPDQLCWLAPDPLHTVAPNRCVGVQTARIRPRSPGSAPLLSPICPPLGGYAGYEAPRALLDEYCYPAASSLVGRRGPLDTGCPCRRMAGAGGGCRAATNSAGLDTRPAQRGGFHRPQDASRPARRAAVPHARDREHVVPRPRCALARLHRDCRRDASHRPITRPPIPARRSAGRPTAAVRVRLAIPAKSAQDRASRVPVPGSNCAQRSRSPRSRSVASRT
jgi:hypothetical protein